MKLYEDLVLDEERALYGVDGAQGTSCTFAGPRDGESALKESSNIQVSNSHFALRYPLWHVSNGEIEDITMNEDCRAPLWYDKGMEIRNSTLRGIKAIRECTDIRIEGCSVHSAEFGWMCHGIEVINSELESEYPFLHSSDIKLENVTFTGKYSFQYTTNVEIKDSRIHTKDAFWHSKNVTVMDSLLSGEYLGWYSENLTLVRCKITGTQPLCYAKKLVVEDCEMVECDLAFEKSDVRASVSGFIDSVKNPGTGHIVADEIGYIILDDEHSADGSCVIDVRSGTTDIL